MLVHIYVYVLLLRAFLSFFSVPIGHLQCSTGGGGESYTVDGFSTL